jgi:hypothetical protein
VGDSLQCSTSGADLILKKEKIMTDIRMHDVKKISTHTHKLKKGVFSHSIFIVSSRGSIELSLFSEDENTLKDAESFDEWIDAWTDFAHNHHDEQEKEVVA